MTEPTAHVARAHVARAHVAILARERDLKPLAEGLRAALAREPLDGLGPELEIVECPCEGPKERLALAACDLVIAGASIQSDEDLAALAPMLQRLRTRRPIGQRHPLLAFALWGPSAPPVAAEAAHGAIVATEGHDVPIEPVVARLRRILPRITPMDPDQRLEGVVRAAEIEHLELGKALREAEARFARDVAEMRIALEEERAVYAAEKAESAANAEQLDQLRVALEDHQRTLADAQSAIREQAARVTDLERVVREKDAALAARERELVELERQVGDGAMAILARDARIYELERALRSGTPASGPFGLDALSPNVAQGRTGQIRTLVAQLRALGEEAEPASP